MFKDVRPPVRYRGIGTGAWLKMGEEMWGEGLGVLVISNRLGASQSFWTRHLKGKDIIRKKEILRGCDSRTLQSAMDAYVGGMTFRELAVKFGRTNSFWRRSLIKAGLKPRDHSPRISARYLASLPAAIEDRLAGVSMTKIACKYGGAAKTWSSYFRERGVYPGGQRQKKRPPLNQEQIDKVIALRRAGLSTTEIQTVMDMNNSIVARYLRKHAPELAGFLGKSREDRIARVAQLAEDDSGGLGE